MHDAVSNAYQFKERKILNLMVCTTTASSQNYVRNLKKYTVSNSVSNHKTAMGILSFQFEPNRIFARWPIKHNSVSKTANQKTTLCEGVFTIWAVISYSASFFWAQTTNEIASLRMEFEIVCLKTLQIDMGLRSNRETSITIL